MQFNTFEKNEFEYIKQLIMFEEKENSELNDIAVNVRVFYKTINMFIYYYKNRKFYSISLENLIKF